MYAALQRVVVKPIFLRQCLIQIILDILFALGYKKFRSRKKGVKLEILDINARIFLYVK